MSLEEFINAMEGFGMQGDRIDHVRTTRGVFRGERIVMSLGAWSPLLAKQLDLPAPADMDEKIAERGHVPLMESLAQAIVAIDGTRFSLSPDARGHGWTGELRIPRDLAPGVYTVELLVTDMAMNVHRASAKVTVR